MLFFSQYWGAQDHKGIARSFGLTWMCMMTVSIIFGGLALFFPQAIMRMYTDKIAIQKIGIRAHAGNARKAEWICVPAGGQSEHDLEGACGSVKSVLPSGMGKAFFLLLMRHALQRGGGICHHPVDERPVDAEGGHLLGEDALGLLEPFLPAKLDPLLAAESDSLLDALFAAALDLVVH